MVAGVVDTMMVMAKGELVMMLLVVELMTMGQEKETYVLLVATMWTADENHY